MRRGSFPTFDLFPFLGILTCLMAVLLLIVMSMVAFSVGPCVAEIWMYSEGTSDKTPVLVEWDGSEVIIYPHKTHVPSIKAFENKGDNDSDFGLLMKQIKDEGNTRYLYFAVRPSGFINFEPIIGLVQANGVDIGYEPVDQNRPLGIIEEEISSAADDKSGIGSKDNPDMATAVSD